MSTQSKFIAVYGVNGIGKTTQVEKLVANLRELGLSVKYLKYPIYDLEPEGPFINKYLRDAEFREANPQTTHELQLKYAQNRLRYQPKLEECLANGDWVVAEDYTGTGVAWGLAWGGEMAYLEEINKDLRQPDLSILMDGERFLTATEAGHRNETNNDKLEACKNFMRQLALRYDWQTVPANDTIDNVQKNILQIVKDKFEI